MLHYNFAIETLLVEYVISADSVGERKYKRMKEKKKKEEM
jgi:hypothetical protein